MLQLETKTGAATLLPTVMLVGKESVGKSQLIASLLGRSVGETNFRGSTVTVSEYRTDLHCWIDTPGIVRTSDSETTRRALEELQHNETVLLVVQATQLDDDLTDMLPLVVGKQGAIVVSYWDKVEPHDASRELLDRLAADIGVSVVAVDTRAISAEDRIRIEAALEELGTFQKNQTRVRAGWRIEPRSGLFERRVVGPIAAACLLLLPAIVTIFGANRVADALHPIVAGAIDPAIAWVNAHCPLWIRILLTAEHQDFGYGVLNMGPFLLVWALPTVLFNAFLLALYKSSGLVDRINVSLHPYVRPLGLSGRDLLRVMMGFGCNVPAVVGTRACSSCSRGTAISAIAFGAACSYQLPATLAVLAAASNSEREAMILSLVFLAYLLVTTAIYLRLTSPVDGRSQLNLLVTPQRPFMQWPRPRAIAREMRETVKQFLLQALPIFLVICGVASALAHWGVLTAGSEILGGAMSLFNLPADAGLPLMLASVRKDGIFLFASDRGLAFPLSASQVLTGVYLAGVLLPCLVTAWTIRRETSWRFTGKLLGRQALFAMLFAAVLAWGGRWLL